MSYDPKFMDSYTLEWPDDTHIRQSVTISKVKCTPKDIAVSIFEPDGRNFINKWVEDPKDTVRFISGVGDIRDEHGWTQESHTDSHADVDPESPVILMQDKINVYDEKVLSKQIHRTVAYPHVRYPPSGEGKDDGGQMDDWWEREDVLTVTWKKYGAKTCSVTCTVNLHFLEHLHNITDEDSLEAHTKEALTKSIVETFKTYLVPALTSALEDTVANEEVFVADEADAAEAAVECGVIMCQESDTDDTTKRCTSLEVAAIKGSRGTQGDAHDETHYEEVSKAGADKLPDQKPVDKKKKGGLCACFGKKEEEAEEAKAEEVDHAETGLGNHIINAADAHAEKKEAAADAAEQAADAAPAEAAAAAEGVAADAKDVTVDVVEDAAAPANGA